MLILQMLMIRRKRFPNDLVIGWFKINTSIGYLGCDVFDLGLFEIQT